MTTALEFSAGRVSLIIVVGLIPFHDRLITEASETALRVVLDVLADPRTDELFSDLLRDNLAQIRAAVREHG
jgi:hypothetical protein